MKRRMLSLIVTVAMVLGLAVTMAFAQDGTDAETVATVGETAYATLAEAVAAKKYDRGILICGTGIGVAIAANKVKGAYAATVNNCYQAQRAELSNHANIITMGSQVTGIEVAKMMVKEYLSHTFDPNSRSAPKIERIYEYERG